MTAYVFDTSALFAYIENEEGAETVHSLLMRAIDGMDEIFISAITAIEIFYVSLQEQGEIIAEKRLELIRELPLIPVPLDLNLTKLIRGIKAKNRMSLADCCIAGLAMSKSATLVHKDPEFEQVSDGIAQVRLPYKSFSRS